MASQVYFLKDKTMPFFLAGFSALRQKTESHAKGGTTEKQESHAKGGTTEKQESHAKGGTTEKQESHAKEGTTEKQESRSKGNEQKEKHNEEEGQRKARWAKETSMGNNRGRPSGKPQRNGKACKKRL